MKKNNNDWISDYQRKKFLEKHRDKTKDVVLPPPLEHTLPPNNIAFMFDVDGTTNDIDASSAQILISQIDKLRNLINADKALICISTGDRSHQKIKDILNILSPLLPPEITIGPCFFYCGIYYFSKDDIVKMPEPFNMDKLSPFSEYYLRYNTIWFALIDDSLDSEFLQFQNIRPMLTILPSQRKESTEKNNFMRLATTTKGIKGVIECLEIYLESIHNMKASQILETQKQMITHLTSYDLMQKIRIKDFPFLIRYFTEGYADENDYYDVALRLWAFAEKTLSLDEYDQIQQLLTILYNHYIDNTENQSLISELKKVLQKK